MGLDQMTTAELMTGVALIMPLVIAGFICAMALGEWYIKRTTFRALDAAAALGQFDELRGAACWQFYKRHLTAEQIARALVYEVPELGEYHPGELTHYVRAWLRKTGRDQT